MIRMTLYCDCDGCEFTLLALPFETRAALHARAAEIGWTTEHSTAYDGVSEPTCDYCPRCSTMRRAACAAQNKAPEAETPP